MSDPYASERVTLVTLRDASSAGTLPGEGTPWWVLAKMAEPRLGHSARVRVSGTPLAGPAFARPGIADRADVDPATGHVAAAHNAVRDLGKLASLVRKGEGSTAIIEQIESLLSLLTRASAHGFTTDSRTRRTIGQATEALRAWGAYRADGMCRKDIHAGLACACARCTSEEL